VTVTTILVLLAVLAGVAGAILFLAVCVRTSPVWRWTAVTRESLAVALLALFGIIGPASFFQPILPVATGVPVLAGIVLGVGASARLLFGQEAQP
jgi:hypothetical protein